MALTQITSDVISSNAISATMIANGSITSAHVANNTITSTHIVSVSNTAITGNIISSQITSVANTQLTGVINSNQLVTSAQYMGFKNRIINGAMVIDQRNAATAVTVNNTAVVTLDRWLVEDGLTTGILSAQQVSDAPFGFINSLKVTASTGSGAIGAGEYAVITQLIEGNNVADLAWGSASAISVTVSFWVKATTTGNYSCTLYNNGASRINPQSYTINVAGTWEQKTITFTGDTTGTWLTNNGRGIVVNFYIALGTTYQSSSGWNALSKYGVSGTTNGLVTTGNTFQITGVQLEAGTQATSFDFRDLSRELIMCQRYYAKSYDYGTIPGSSNIGNGRVGYYAADTNTTCYAKLPINMRVAPTLTVYSTYDGASGYAREGGTTTNKVVTPLGTGETSVLYALLGTATATNFYYTHYTVSAEL